MSSHDQTGSSPAAPPIRSQRGVGRLWWLMAGILAVIAVGIWVRTTRVRALASSAQEAQGPRRVATIVARRAPALVDVTLPGTAQPILTTTLHARTTAFVRRLHVDMGDRVRPGQLLAELEAPEVEQELRVARARQAEAQQNVGLAQGTAERHARLAVDGVSSKQQADDARAQANSATAALQRTRAEVQRLAALRGYLRIVAPFEGVVTRRHVDSGALVSPGAGPGLFEVSQTSALKVYVDVPQAFASFVQTGQKVVVAARGAAAKVEGKIVRTAGALDESTRTLRTEVHLPSTQGLLAGSFVNVAFSVSRAEPPVVIPAAALVVRKEGPQVFVVKDGRARSRKVAIGIDRGREVEIVDGLSGGEALVLNAPENLTADEAVRAVEAAPRAR
jgi:membrane fusion protein, multidrug efflux system